MKYLLITTFVSGLICLFITNLAEVFLKSRVAVIGSLAGFKITFNQGIAFGLRLPPYLQELMILAAIIIIAWYAVTFAKTKFTQFAFGLIIGGGLANIIDRIPDNTVTDFIQIGSFPVFNAADSCITVGVALLATEMLIERRNKRQ